MVTIWFEPHGTTFDNEAKKGSGWNDVDLSEKGFRDAVEIIARCKSRAVEAIFCSDLQRAVKTAVPSADELHLPLYPDKRLRECNYGDYTQRDKDFIQQERPKRISVPFPNGESYEQCMKRMAEFLKDLKAKFNDKTVLIIGHRATHYGLDHHILGRSILDSTEEDFVWQPGWKYELN